MQKSAANVDDGMRIINRLIAALSELLSMKSVSGILHTCATLGESLMVGLHKNRHFRYCFDFVKHRLQR